MSAHPTPRFEIVHKPRRMVPSYNSTAVTVEEDNPQPWSARFVGDNGEEVWRTSETYVDVRDAERAIALMAEALGSQALFEGSRVKKDAPRPAQVSIVRVEVGP